MNMPENIITSATNPVIKKVRGLEQKKFREETGLFVVEGLRYVSEALLAGWRAEIVLYTPRLAKDRSLRSLMEKQNPQFITVAPELLERLTGRSNSEEIIVAFHQKFAPVEAVASGLWVALEQIRDPGNLGTIIRTAEAAGAGGVLLIGDCCDVWAPEVVRASVGAISRVKIVKMSEADYLSWAKAYKGAIIATLMSAKPDYRDARYNLPALLLMGSEHAGLSDKVAASCTMSVRIPMQGQIESLNVATATAILLYEIMRGK